MLLVGSSVSGDLSCCPRVACCVSCRKDAHSHRLNRLLTRECCIPLTYNQECPPVSESEQTQKFDTVNDDPVIEVEFLDELSQTIANHSDDFHYTDKEIKDLFKRLNQFQNNMIDGRPDPEAKPDSTLLRGSWIKMYKHLHVTNRTISAIYNVFLIIYIYNIIEKSVTLKV